jgi:uncharacterized membrane protein YhiD involved in acid resistance
MEAEVAKTLIETNNPTFMWVGIALFAMQIIFIPGVMYLFKYFSSQSKQLTDTERKITAMERDGQIKDINARIDRHELQDQHKEEEANRTMESMCKAIEKIGNKVDKIYAKVYNIE